MKIIGLLVLTVALSSAVVFEMVITEAELQTSLEEAVVDPNVTSVDVDIQTGKIVLAATRTRPLTGVEDQMSMEIFLDVEDGHIEISIEDAFLNGIAIDESRLAVWNGRIARSLERLTGSGQGTLETISVGTNRITLVWD